MALFARKHKKPLGIYIHVPFCRSKCQYCDFYSLATNDTHLMHSYMTAICAHIKEAGALAPQYLVDTIYFGGGTPTFFGAAGMATILTAIRKSFDVSSEAEITFEANPDSVSDPLLRRLRNEGFNRVSLGIQCDNDEILRKIGRVHNYQQAVNAVKRIRKKGFRNLSVDLMYGLPGQTLDQWVATLENVLKLAPEHISCYGLKVEEGTPLYEIQDACNLADDDTQADMYLTAIQILRDHGYRQYEISNFSPNASSDFGGRRFTIIADLQGYIDGIKNGGQVLQDVQEVAPRERAGEYLMMRLRTTSGVDPRAYEQNYLLPFAPLEPAFIRCRENGLAEKTFDGRWRLTPKGFLVSNSIISDLLLIQESTASTNKKL